jgi:hypothetical protein
VGLVYPATQNEVSHDRFIKFHDPNCNFPTHNAEKNPAGFFFFWPTNQRAVFRICVAGQNDADKLWACIVDSFSIASIE